MSDLQTFTYFPLLPKEIRLRIWRHTLPGQRNLSYQYWYQGPIALRVCYESRAEALKHYRKSDHPTATYIDFSVDTISQYSLASYIIPDGYPSYLPYPCTSERDVNSITSIACCEYFDENLFRNARSTILTRAAEYPNLREIHIHVLPRREEHLGSEEERHEILSSIIAHLQNDPVTPAPEDEGRDGSIIEPATTDLRIRRNEVRDEITEYLSNRLNGVLEAREEEEKRRVDFTLQMSTNAEVDWMYGAASCPPWGEPWRRCHTLGEWEGAPRDRDGPLDCDL